MTVTSKQVLAGEPEEVEALLPWHAAGTLNPRDARRVEDALARDPALAKQYAVIQDEYTETILLNESLGAPSSRAMQKLFAAIDAEPARSPALAQSLSARIVEFFGSLSPRTLAVGSAAAAIALLLQAGVIGAVLVNKQGGTYQTASHHDAASAAAAVKAVGTRALVQFAPEARASDITNFLNTYSASIIGGPKAGAFQIKFNDKALPKDEVDQLLKRVQSEKIVAFAAAE
ncbi:MAG: hypothetical protein A4S14_03195 [Proteobacteria bacterium SG_bin9]|nr:MAG: hypothetical protein A4S14_03195 [Proteobacteria bacterium SG_bin9]